jgi:hypothetical protein
MEEQRELLQQILARLPPQAAPPVRPAGGGGPGGGPNGDPGGGGVGGPGGAARPSDASSNTSDGQVAQNIRTLGSAASAARDSRFPASAGVSDPVGYAGATRLSSVKEEAETEAEVLEPATATTATATAVAADKRRDEHWRQESQGGLGLAAPRAVGGASDAVSAAGALAASADSEMEAPPLPVAVVAPEVAPA